MGGERERDGHGMGTGRVWNLELNGNGRERDGNGRERDGNG